MAFWDKFLQQYELNRIKRKREANMRSQPRTKQTLKSQINDIEKRNQRAKVLTKLKAKY